MYELNLVIYTGFVIETRNLQTNRGVRKHDFEQILVNFSIYWNLASNCFEHKINLVYILTGTSRIM